MLKGKTVKIFFVFFLLFLIIFLIFNNFFKEEKIIQSEPEIIDQSEPEIIDERQLLIQTIEKYKTNDPDGNEYIISAIKGEIDFTNNNIIFLTKVTAVIKLKNSDNIIITSDFGKYNSENFDTIFSKNVIINYVIIKLQENIWISHWKEIQ